MTRMKRRERENNNKKIKTGHPFAMLV